MKHAVIAAGVSVALHAGVLLFLFAEAAPLVVMPAQGPKPVQLEVMRLAAIVSGSKQAQRAALVPAVVRTVVGRPAAKATPALLVADPGVPSSEVAEESATPGGASEPATEPGDSALFVPGASRAPVAAPLDTSALSRRLQQVALRCYPAAARRFRQTGEAQVRFCLDGTGALRDTTVIHSTGSELLDHAASGCVVPGAAPFGPETFGRCFTVPVRFNP